MLAHLKLLQARISLLQLENRSLKSKLEQQDVQKMENEQKLRKEVLDPDFEKRVLSANENLSRLIVLNPESEEILAAKLDILKILKDLKVHQWLEEFSSTKKSVADNMKILTSEASESPLASEAPPPSEDSSISQPSEAKIQKPLPQSKNKEAPISKHEKLKIALGDIKEIRIKIVAKDGSSSNWKELKEMFIERFRKCFEMTKNDEKVDKEVQTDESSMSVLDKPLKKERVILKARRSQGAKGHESKGLEVKKEIEARRQERHFSLS